MRLYRFHEQKQGRSRRQGSLKSRSSNDLQTETGSKQLHRKSGATVLVIEDRTDLDHLQGCHATPLGESFHQQVDFSVGQSAAHRSAGPHGHRRVDAVNIDNHMDVIRFSHQSVQHLVCNTLDSYSVSSFSFPYAPRRSALDSTAFFS